MIAFGANATIGGTTQAKGHSDSILLNATFCIDGEPVIIDGEFMDASGLRHLA